MSKHTPGPWFASFYKRAIVVSGESPAHSRGNFNIAKFPMRTNESLVSHDEWTANANLLAAAPEMIEILTHIKTQFGDGIGEKLDAWITRTLKKAKGES